MTFFCYNNNGIEQLYINPDKYRGFQAAIRCLPIQKEEGS